MNITIKTLNIHDVHGDGSDVVTTFAVIENGKEFMITCSSNRTSRTVGLAEKEGILYIDRDDNMVHRQKVALGGGCGLLIDDEPVEGLSPLALRGVIIAEQNREAREIMITTFQSENDSCQPLVLVNGNKEGLRKYSDAFDNIL